MSDSKQTTDKNVALTREKSSEPGTSGAPSDELSNDQTMTLWQTAQSVLYAMLGVQKSKNAKRDFSKGKASHFIILGVAFGILFVLVVALVVSIVLRAVVGR